MKYKLVSHSKSESVFVAMKGLSNINEYVIDGTYRKATDSAVPTNKEPKIK